MSDSSQIANVVVLGAGSAGWLSAVTLKLLLPQLNVTVIHAPAIEPIGVGEATTASFPAFLHRDLCLDRHTFYAAVKPSWKLGIRFLWGDSANSEFYYPFRSGGDCPDVFGQSNAHYGLTDYARGSLFAQLMSNHRSACFESMDGQTQIDETFGYHFDTVRLSRHLQGVATHLGVAVREAQVVDVRRHSSEKIAALQLDDGSLVFGEFFIDCSGFRSHLIGQLLAEPFHSYASSLFCDAAVIGSWSRDEPILPYTTAETMQHGWCWRIDLTERISRGYVYSSAFCDPETASKEFLANNPRVASESVRHIQFRSGRYSRFWVGNVAAVGNSAGFVEPLESTGLHMTMETITAICRALIDTDLHIVPEMQSVANQFIGQMWDDVRDFLAIHFRFNRRVDSPFWQHCRDETDLAGAETLIEFFRRVGPSRIGHTLLCPQSVFGHRGYMEMLAGMKVPMGLRFRPRADEQLAWEQGCRQVQKVVQCATSIEQALALVGDVNWRWSV